MCIVSYYKLSHSGAPVSFDIQTFGTGCLRIPVWVSRGWGSVGCMLNPLPILLINIGDLLNTSLRLYKGF